MTTHTKRSGRINLNVQSPVPLEQMLFSKMTLYSSIYHHQKVRSSECSLKGIVELIKNNGDIRLNGKNFSEEIDFLYFTDSDILNGLMGIDDNNLNGMIKRIINRNMLKRAAVICKETVDNWDDCYEYLLERLSKLPPGKLYDLRMKILAQIPKNKRCLIHELWIDIPKQPSLREASQTYVLLYSNKEPVRLNKLFPTDAWLRQYAIHKWRGHVFCPPDLQKDVFKAARVVLIDELNIKLNDNAAAYSHIRSF
jgi:HD superfamily phosphohydrolase